MNATHAQIKALNAILARTGQMDNKAAIITGATGGRTASSRELTMQEARELLLALNKGTNGAKKQPRGIAYIFKMAHEMGWVKEKHLVDKMGIKKYKDYTILHEWINKYGYLQKPLDQYSPTELPKLVYQLEKVHDHFLSKL